MQSPLPAEPSAPRGDRRLLKGTIVGAAGLAMLLGGGTFAVWYQTEGVDGGSVNSGELSFSLSDAVWVNQASTAIVPAEYQVVPGDTLTLTQNVNIVAVGDTLEATFSFDATALSGDDELVAALDIDLAVTPLPSGWTSDGDDSYDFAAAEFNSSQSDTPIAVPVVLTIAFPDQNGAVDWGQLAQGQSVDLSTVTFDLRQTL
ncbi:alternate-type signal peptide domain-containing protein [Desertimonas flava]|uniref:alternate-type signal peptide domain-containing protein n=1 Tax=Desertimonas flava TaxID=2064846 RepID=UPI000E34B220|nr:alternate-type signal peptide domain-containing protein [Desertimonas flava]